ncbi:MAG TPA: TfoX/Sxy family protein [Candidatus Eisenbacteria bacterium]|jgi:DNA transformation protein|nr:TfoX/Sxy family protein [Candidatus Eisenbacteria bacterium]
MTKSDYAGYVVSDLLVGLDGVTARAMFGEYALYLDGTIFALVCDDVLYFKADETNRARYEKAGSRQYTYRSGGKDVTMPYWEVPADILEDREEIAKWARESQRVTLKAHPKKCA